MEREVGGGIGMGTTWKLKDVSFQCMTKFTTNKIKKKKRKKKKENLSSYIVTKGGSTVARGWGEIEQDEGNRKGMEKTNSM